MKAILVAWGLLLGSLWAMADDTNLSARNILGTYTLKAGDASVEASLELTGKMAKLQYKEDEASVRCQGTFRYDEKNYILEADVLNCGSNKSSLTYTLYLSGQTAESLKELAYVLVSISVDGADAKPLAFSIQKIK